MSELGINFHFIAQTGGSFLTENKEGVFYAALVFFSLSGLAVGLFDVFKKTFVIGFSIFLLFPTIDIHFFVDLNYKGVTRGLFVTLADMFLLSLFTGTIIEATRRKVRFVPRGIPIFIVFMLICAMTILNMRSFKPAFFTNPGYYYGLFELFNLFKGLILLWVMINFLRTEKEIKFLLYLIAGMIIVETLYVIYAHLVLHRWSRAAGSLGHPNGLAMFVGMFVPLLLVMALSYRNKGVGAIIMLGALLGAFTVMIKTGSRAGIGSMCIASAVALLLLLKNARQLNWIRIVGISFLFLVGAGFVVTRYWDRLYGRFGEVAKEAHVSSVSRRRLTEAGKDIWLSSPYVGHGINSFPMEVTLDSKYYESRAEEHNLYLLMLAETGIIGCAAMVLVFLMFLHNGWKKVYRQKVSSSMRIISIGLMCGMLHVMIHNYFEFIFRAVYVSYFFWVLAAALIACGYVLDDKIALIRRMRRKSILLKMQKAKERSDFSEIGT